MECIMTKQCKACGKAFQSHPKVPTQTYCSSPECQRERRRRWLEEKRQVDADYQGNEPQKIEQWRNEHPDYWKQYRQANPDYADRNRNLQQTRNQRSRNPVIANEYELPKFSSLPSGRYRLIPVIADVIANEYEFIVEITVLSMP
jgi:endogenous inhibitor of DNA gyrase (YacG/DUF329 family)